MKRRILYIALLVIFLGTFLVSGYFLVDYLLDSHEQKNMYQSLDEMVSSARQEAQKNQATTPGATGSPDAPDSTGVPVPVDPADLLVTVTDPDTGEEVTLLQEFAQVYLLNNDLVGWIQVPGTELSYPVVQTPEEKDAYLYQNFMGEYNKHGCIYVREQCDVNAPSDNVTIYGHCMQDGSMFAGLSEYTSKTFWEAHQTFTFDTLTEYHTYQIIAVFKTSANLNQGFSYHQFVNASDQAEFDEFVSTCKRLSFYDTGVTAEYGDKLVCLSTCEYTLSNGRLVVVAKRIS